MKTITEADFSAIKEAWYIAGIATQSAHYEIAYILKTSIAEELCIYTERLPRTTHYDIANHLKKLYTNNRLHPLHIGGNKTLHDGEFTQLITTIFGANLRLFQSKSNDSKKIVNQIFELHGGQLITHKPPLGIRGLTVEISADPKKLPLEKQVDLLCKQLNYFQKQITELHRRIAALESKPATEFDVKSLIEKINKKLIETL